jgi:hypothetical protein
VDGARITLQIGSTPALQTDTDNQGQFHFNALSDFGLAELHIDGGTATALGGRPLVGVRLPTLSFAPFLLENVANSLPGPVYLPRLLATNDQDFDGTQDVLLTVDGVEGFEILVTADTRVTKPDGSLVNPANPITLSLNQVHFDELPMPPPDGAAPVFAWTLQPAGVQFDPPLPITHPNVAGLPPGSTTNFLVFDHAAGRFLIVATGQVTTDGRISQSDPGVGVAVSGWGAQCPPYAETANATGQ